MAVSSRWLAEIERMIASGESPSPYDPSIGLRGSATPDVPMQPAPTADVSAPADTASSGLSAQSDSSYWDRLAGSPSLGLSSFLTAAYDPTPGAQNSGAAKGLAIMGGLLRAGGRALASAYGNPGYAIAARAADDDATLGQQRVAAYQQQVDASLAAQRDAKRSSAADQARQAAALAALQGLDPTTESGNAEAVARLTALGEVDAATKVRGLLREKKPPQHRTRGEDAYEVFEEFDPETGAFVERSRAPRWKPGAGGRDGGGADPGVVTSGTGIALDDYGQPVDPWSVPPFDPQNKQAAITARTMGRQLEHDSKDFVTLQSARRQMDELEKAEGPAAEIATLYQFIKQLDPGSVVREGEVSLSTQGMSYFDRLGLAYKKVADGGVVSRDMKQDLIDTARKLYRAQLPAQIEREKRAFRMGALQGVPPAALGGSRLSAEDWDTAYGKSVENPEIKVVGGVRYRKVPGGWRRE